MSKGHKAEFHKKNMEDKAAQAAQQAMHVELKGMLADNDKGLKEQMANKSHKNSAELEALKQSQMATQKLIGQKLYMSRTL
jgi:acyl-CoA hydrolase